MNKVFLGGTVNNSTWREQVMPHIEIEMFNPVVDDWTEEMQKIEMDEKDNKCNIHLYVITSEMTGVFSIAEAMDSVHNKEKTTFFHVLPSGFSTSQLKSLKAVVDLIKLRGGHAYIDPMLTRTIGIINGIKNE